MASLTGLVEGTVNSVRCHPTQPLLAISTWNRRIVLAGAQFEAFSAHAGAFHTPVTVNGAGSYFDSSFSLQTPDVPTAIEWTTDGSRLFFGDGRGMLTEVDATTGSTVVEKRHPHRGAISGLTSPSESLIWSVAYDGTVVLTDLRSAQAAVQCTVAQKVYCAASTRDHLVVGKALEGYEVFDPRVPGIAHKKSSKLSMSFPICIAMMGNEPGFLGASPEARVEVHFLTENRKSRDFSYRCHRANEKTDAFGINDIRFSRHNHNYITAGGDGTVNFWDYESRQRAFELSRVLPWEGSVSGAAPIVSADFAHDDSVVVMAVANDFAQGMNFYNPKEVSSIFYFGTRDRHLSSTRVLPRD